MTQPCPHCPGLRAEVARLQLEVAVLERIIAAAQRECMTLASEAAQPMPEGVPRGTWAFAKGERAGKGEAAGRVMGRLNG